MKNKYLFLLMFALLLSPSAYASVGSQEDGNMESIDTDLNWSTNLDHSSSGSVGTVSVSSSPTFTGDVTFRSSIIANGRYAASTQVASSSTNLAPTNLPYGILYKNIGGGTGDSADGGTKLPNGVAGQTITFIISSGGGTGGGTWVITPTTKTGFTTITFNNKGQGATLLYLNDTIGWVITSTFSTASTALPTVAQTLFVA